MSITTAIAIFFVIWWISLFLVLPFGVRSQHEDGEIVPGSEPGAPITARIARKLMWTTVVAAVLFAAGTVFYHFVGFGVLDQVLP
jgi:predicted secreted protein